MVVRRAKRHEAFGRGSFCWVGCRIDAASRWTSSVGVSALAASLPMESGVIAVAGGGTEVESGVEFLVLSFACFCLPAFQIGRMKARICTGLAAHSTQIVWHSFPIHINVQVTPNHPTPVRRHSRMGMVPGSAEAACLEAQLSRPASHHLLTIVTRLHDGRHTRLGFLNQKHSSHLP